ENNGCSKEAECWSLRRPIDPVLNQTAKHKFLRQSCEEKDPEEAEWRSVQLRSRETEANKPDCQTQRNSNSREQKKVYESVRHNLAVDFEAVSNRRRLVPDRECNNTHIERQKFTKDIMDVHSRPLRHQQVANDPKLQRQPQPQNDQRFKLPRETERKEWNA